MGVTICLKPVNNTAVLCCTVVYCTSTVVSIMFCSPTRVSDSNRDAAYGTVRYGTVALSVPQL